MSFSMMTIQPSISQDVKDNEEWERKKKKQQSEMALANARANPTGEVDRFSGSLGVNGIASANVQKPQAPVKYPTPADLPKYGSIDAAAAGQKQAMANMLSTGFGQGYSVPSVKGGSSTASNPNTPSPSRTAMTDKQVNSAASPVMSENNDAISSAQGSKSYGLSITPSPDKPSGIAEFAKSLQGMNTGTSNAAIEAPRRSAAEEAERAAVFRQASTVQKGANGITAAQLGVQRRLTEGNDAINSDIYKAQLGAQNSLEQAQLREQGANSRAVLGELSAEQRQTQQLGFDASKFQQSAGLDSRRLDMQQANDDIKNKAPTELNALYDSYKIAESDEDRAAILNQMKVLNGGGGSEQKDSWTAVKGPQVTGENGLPMDGETYLLNKSTGETRPLNGQSSQPMNINDPKIMSNPKVAAIMNNPKTNYDQKMAELEALGVTVN